MNCNCKLDIEKKLLENLQAAAPEAAGHYVELNGYGLAITDNTMVLRGYMPYKASAEYPLKKGGTRNKKMAGTMVFSYCPFCGAKA